MDAVVLAAAFWRLMGTNDFAAVAAVLAEDFILDWPQSGERIRGAGNFAQVNANYPAAERWVFSVERLLGDASQAVSLVQVTDGVLHATAMSWFTAQGGKITHIVEYWPEPFPPRADRAKWVERIAGL